MRRTFIYFLISLHNVFAKIYVNNDPTPTRTNNIDDVYLRFYNGSTINYFVQFPLSQASLLFDIVGFDESKPIVVYTHGYQSSADSDSVQAVASSYRDTKPDTNFVALDWSNMAQGDYVTNAVPNTKTIGLTAAAQINILITNGLPLNNIYLVGHSLGAQISGYIARTLKNTYQQTIKRVTGLDPAYPSFYPDGLYTTHIRASDAEFVDIIHSDAGGFGAPVSTGTADFWPNGGTSLQPGCSIPVPQIAELSCSHGRAWVYYAESVRTPDAFPASPNDSYIQFKLNTNPANGMKLMGYGCPSSAAGNYYLTTNSESPYGKGMAGLSP